MDPFVADPKLTGDAGRALGLSGWLWQLHLLLLAVLFLIGLLGALAMRPGGWLDPDRTEVHRPRERWQVSPSPDDTPKD
jgi:hypothetical protein